MSELLELPPRGELAPQIQAAADDAMSKRVEDVDLEAWNEFKLVRKSEELTGTRNEDGRRRLNEYKQRRLQRGERPFQYLEKARRREQDAAFRERLPFYGQLFSGPEQFDQAFPEEHRAAVAARFAGSLDPGKVKMQTANLMLVAEMTGEPVEKLQKLWPAYRSQYAKQALGAQGPVDDAAFYALAGKKLQGQKADGETAEAIGAKVQAAAISARPLADALADAKAMAGERWKEFEPTARAAYAGVLADYDDRELATARELFQRTAKLEGKDVEKVTEGTTAFLDYAKASPADREKIMGLLALQAQAEGEDVEGYFRRVGAVFKGTGRMTAGVLSRRAKREAALIRTLIGRGTLPADAKGISTWGISEFRAAEDATRGPTGMAIDIAPPAATRPMTAVEKEMLEGFAAITEGQAAFQQDIQGAGVKVRRYLDANRKGFWNSVDDWSLMALESLPTMAAAALPYGAGLPLVVTGYGEQELARLQNIAPDADPDRLAAQAYAVGGLMAGVERLDWLILGARFPKLQAKLLKMGAPGWAANLGVKAGLITAVQGPQEVVQDLTAPAVQDLASALSEDIPGVEWGPVLERERAALGDIFGVSMIFGIVGATGSSVVDVIQAPKLKAALTDREGLSLAGYSAETVEEVATLAETNPAAAAETLKAATIETPVETRRANSQAARERMEADPPPTPEEAAIPSIERAEDGGFNVRYPDGRMDRATSESDALAAVRAWEMDDSDRMDQANRQLARELEASHAENPELAAGFKFTGKEVTMADWAGENGAKLETARQRVRIAMRQEFVVGEATTDGSAIPDAELPLDAYLILGNSQNFGGAVTRISMEIHTRGNVATVLEEHAEGVGKWLMESGKYTRADIVRGIRETEAATGKQTLPDDLDSLGPEASTQAIAEAFSRLAVANAFGKIPESSLSAKFKALFRAIKEAFTAIIALAADIRAVQLAGQMDADFEYWLDVAGGVSEQYQRENLQKAAEREMLDQAFEGMPEIRDTLAGRLPHPDTPSLQFRGEIRTIYDGMRNDPASGASPAARTRKANEYFLPFGEIADLDQVREAVNEKGFSFDRIDDMLEALDLSVNFGKPQYGVSAGMDTGETFSIARAPGRLDLPEAVLGHPLAAATSHPDYSAAKSGDLDAAERLAGDLVTPEFIARVRAAIGEGRPVVVPVLAIEAAGNNKIPLAVAEALAHGLGSTFGTDIYQARRSNRSAADGLDRVFIGSEFAGPVAAGESYLLVDDTLTQGGTFAALADHVTRNGGRVAGIIALTGKDYSRMLSLSDGTLSKVRARLGDLESDFREATGHGFDSLTESEARTLATWKPLESVRSRILAGRDAARRGDPAPAPGGEGLGATLSAVRADSPLLKAIEALGNSPEATARVFVRMREKVGEVRDRMDQTRRTAGFSEDDLDPERFEKLRDLATLEAIAKALPPPIRGKFIGSFRALEELKTTKGREKYLINLLPKVEQALEAHLVDQFRAAIRREMVRGAVKVAESKTRGGKIGATAHMIFDEAKAAMILEPDAAEAAALKIQQQIEGADALTMEQLAELDARQAAIELFHDFQNATSARLEQGLELLKSTYREGRAAWLETLMERRMMRDHRVLLVQRGLGLTYLDEDGIEQPVYITDAMRAAAVQADKGGKRKLAEGIMSAFLSGSQKLRRLGELTQDPEVRRVVEGMEDSFAGAEALETDLNLADNAELAEAFRAILGTKTEYGLAKKLRELSEAKTAAPVEKIEGRKKQKIAVPIKLVESLLARETGGFVTEKGERIEMDEHDLEALKEEWEKFQDLPEEDQGKKRVINFARILASGKRQSIGAVSQLEGLQLYLTLRQPDQAKKLERTGYDETTLEELEAWLKPEVKALGAWMVGKLAAEQGAVDALHRSEKGVGLRLVDNYFPVRNDVSRADAGGLSLDGTAAQQSGRSVSFIKERVANNAPPGIVNALAVYLAHRAQSNFWKSHVTPMREWGGLLRDERFAMSVKVRIGADYYRSTSRLLERIESGGQLAAAQVASHERVVKYLMRNFSLGTLGLRVSTLMVNTTAALNAGLEIPARDLIRGMVRAAQRPEAFKDAWNSPVIQRRLAAGSSVEAQMAKAAGPSTSPVRAQLQAYAEKGVAPINYVDTAANLLGAASVWEYTRTQAVAAGLPDAEARTEADAAVERVFRRAAQPTSRLSRSELELRALDNPLSALLSMFISEPRKNLAIAFAAGRELLTGKGTYGTTMAAQQVGVSLVVMVAAEYVVRSLYAAIAKGKDEEDEDGIVGRFLARLTDAKAWGHHVATGHLKSIPVAGEAWNQAMGMAFDQKTFASAPNPLNKAVATAPKIMKLFADDATARDSIEGGIDIVQAFGSAAPGGPIFSQLANVADFGVGVATSNGVDFTPADRAKRIKSQYSAFGKELGELHGKTTGEDGKIRKDIQEKKTAARADWLRSRLEPLPPGEREKVLEALKLEPGSAIRKRME